MRIVLLGKPIPQERHRSYRRGSFIGQYDPCSEQKEFVKEQIGMQLAEALNSANKNIAMEASSLKDCPAFCVKMSFHFPIGKSTNSKQRNRLLWGIEGCDTKPDLDNLEKFYLDCLTSILWKDDCQVSNLSSCKFYSSKPRTEIEIVQSAKPDLHKEAERILELFGPDDLFNFIQDAYKLFELYDVDETDDWVTRAVAEGDAQGVRLARTAVLLSNLADGHAKNLMAIARKHPRFWEKAINISSKEGWA